MIPDFYESLEECLKNRYNTIQTNPRYKNFKQRHYTAGDDQQFFERFDQIKFKNHSDIELDNFKQFELCGKNFRIFTINLLKIPLIISLINSKKEFLLKL